MQDNTIKQLKDQVVTMNTLQRDGQDNMTRRPSSQKMGEGQDDDRVEEFM